MQCYKCDGLVAHHQDGAKSWLECGDCGLTGPKIDMSDTNHVKEAALAWQTEAQIHAGSLEAKENPPQLSVPPEEQATSNGDAVADDESGQDQPPDWTEGSPQAGVAGAPIVGETDGPVAAGGIGAAAGVDGDVAVDGQEQSPMPPDDVSDEADPSPDAVPVSPEDGSPQQS
jgi:hypothetical protein